MQTSSGFSNPAAPTSIDRSARPALVVFSHLRWGFVFQRPQHLLTRLARDFDVFFFEEPVFADGPPHLEANVRAPGVEVLTPHTDVRAPGFDDAQAPLLKKLLAAFLADRGIVDPLVWFYTPMALPLLADLEPRAVVYDCMDDLASFKFAPPELVQRESSLMQLADIVLTGGPSLYEARKNRHANIHCLPSAVDALHFDPTRLDADAAESEPAASLHRGLSHPRLGFFGVIDERLDVELVAGIADRRPDWQIVMVGPVVKIDPSALPQRPNLHWVGMQSYDALPHWMSHWDACLLPFALNEATTFISPTKTLEYLAGGKPVVSTRIRDVETLYCKAVRFGSDADEFVAAVAAALAETPAERARWRAEARTLVEGCTWAGTAALIGELLQEYVAAMPSDEIIVLAPSDMASASAPIPTLHSAHPVPTDASHAGDPHAAPTLAS